MTPKDKTLWVTYNSDGDMQYLINMIIPQQSNI